MRVLVIQTAFIGDLVLTTPFLAVLKKRWPGVTIDVVTTPAGKEIFEGIEGVNTFVLDKKGTSLLSGLKGIRAATKDIEYDIAFCVHRSPRSLWIANSVRAKQKIAFRSLIALALGFRTVRYPEYSEQLHYSQKPMALLNYSGDFVSVDSLSGLRPHLVERSTDSRWAEKQLEKFSNPIVLSPFSVWGTKNWFPERFAQVALRLAKTHGTSTVLVGDDSKECVAAGLIIEKTLMGKPVLNLVGKTTLSQLKSVIARAKVVLANDSSAIHIAAAFDIPTAAVFGPTVKKWGFFRLSTNSVVVENKTLSCRPCHLHGPTVCPKKHFKCMDEIQVEQVTQAVERLLV